VELPAPRVGPLDGVGEGVAEAVQVVRVSVTGFAQPFNRRYMRIFYGV